MAAPKVIELVRARFANIKQYSDALSVVHHSGVLGRFREILAENLLEPYLPPTIELLSGTIIGADGQERLARNEDDIVLFDRSLAPLLLRTRGRDAIIPITGVRSHIEVKSNLKKEHISEAVKAGAELINMAQGEAPTGLIFAYSSEIAKTDHIPELLLDAVQKSGYRPNPGQTPCPIQGVCILGRGSWVLTHPDPEGDSKRSGWYEVKAQEDRELLAFISIVSNSMFANKLGLGTHVLDTSWLEGPHPESPIRVRTNTS